MVALTFQQTERLRLVRRISRKEDRCRAQSRNQQRQMRTARTRRSTRSISNAGYPAPGHHDVTSSDRKTSRANFIDPLAAFLGWGTALTESPAFQPAGVAPRKRLRLGGERSYEDHI